MPVLICFGLKEEAAPFRKSARANPERIEIIQPKVASRELPWVKRGGQIRQAAEQRQIVAHSANCGVLFYDQSSSGRSDRNFTDCLLPLLRSLTTGENCIPTARAVGYFLFAALRLNDRTHLLRPERRSRAVPQDCGAASRRRHAHRRHRPRERREIGAKLARRAPFARVSADLRFRRRPESRFETRRRGF